MRDRNYKLILRVRHNVIKAGVRRISSAYSSISLTDVAEKLQLDSAEDAEFIIAKVSCVDMTRTEPGNLTLKIQFLMLLWTILCEAYFESK